MNSYTEQSIGIFDSGIGGLSIWEEISSLLPSESTIYLADSKNAPYGKKSKDEIIQLCIKNTEALLKKKCKIIVVACNTATTNAIDYLRDRYDIPFIGIEPAIKPASLKTKTNTIGILATKGTLNSRLFEATSTTIDKDVQIIEQVGEGLVELIERGKLNSDEMTSLLNNHLQKIVQHSIDYLVLGCTHYSYLIPQIKKIIGPNIQIIDSGEAVAKQTKNILFQAKLLQTHSSTATHQFYSNNNTNLLQNILPKDSKNKINYLDF